jgi:hypothetical protein
MTSVVSIGHLSTTALAAITLGSMTANVSGFSIIQGFTSALDTMLPSAWTSSQPQLVGLWAQRMSACMAPVWQPLCWSNIMNSSAVVMAALLVVRVRTYSVPVRVIWRYMVLSLSLHTVYGGMAKLSSFSSNKILKSLISLLYIFVGYLWDCQVWHFYFPICQWVANT